MHRAPAVNFSVKRSRWQARCIAGLSLLALVTFAVFAREQAALDVRTGLVALAGAIGSGAALQAWRQSLQGQLRWDGQYWRWSGFAENPVCRLVLLMDFQRVVVVGITAEAHAPMLLWLEGEPGDANWKPLRRAIVSSQADSGIADPKAGLAEGGSA